MSVLFATRKRARSVVDSDKRDGVVVEGYIKGHKDESRTTTSIAESFESLGINSWLVKKCSQIGMTTPTTVQQHCIPAILDGRNVLGVAQTGSGKTAAFALPILHSLSMDPYGPFAVILTPTRELAFQIADQMNIFGTFTGVRCAVIDGGMDMLEQKMKLQQQPHIIIATPGRLHDHLMHPDAPNLSLVKFLVLDEADRLLEQSFKSDLTFVLGKLPPAENRQTLYFTATLTEELNQVAGSDSFRFDGTASIKTRDALEQYYLFFPQQIKMTYLMYLLLSLTPQVEETNRQKQRYSKHSAKSLEKTLKSLEATAQAAKSVIVFVSKCQTCELIGEVTRELGLNCVTLHSIMSQSRRLAALGKFTSGLAPILISTDVASRGLDIPTVDVVIQFDLPRVASTYIHRVGRACRTGGRGRSISLVTQHDIALLQHLEAHVGKKMDNYEVFAKEEQVLKLLNDVSVATRCAKLKLYERGFEDKVRERKARRSKQYGRLSDQKSHLAIE